MRFLGQVVENGNFWTPPPKRKFWLITEQLIFWYFLVCLAISFFLLFLLFLFLVFFCLEGLRVRWGGPKGHLTWPWTLLIFWGVLLFLSLSFFIEKHSPLKRAFLFIFECLPLFLLSLFLASPFFTSSFSASLLLFSFFFLPVCLCLLSFGSFFVSFYIFLYCLLLFHEKNNMKLLNFKVVFINPFSLFGFLSCFLFQISFFLSLFFFPDFDLCFLFNINVFAFKKDKLKTPIFEKKGGCNITFFCMSPFFVKCEKLPFLGGPFLPNYGWC